MNGIIEHIERLKLILFFAGYPILFAFIFAFADDSKDNLFSKLFRLLPKAYFLIGILFIGLLLKDLYTDFTNHNLLQQTINPYLKIWGILSLLFGFSFFNKNPILSLLHSLVFFYFIIQDFLFAHSDIIRNDMKIYSISIALNLLALSIVSILNYLLKSSKKPME